MPRVEGRGLTSAEWRVVEQDRQLRSLAARVALAEEQERRRISRGLHDDVGQTLAVAKLRLGALLEVADATSLAPAIEEIRALLDHSIRATRSLTFELSPPLLYELGPAGALRSFAQQLERESGVRIRFEPTSELLSLPQAASGVLYRVGRELLLNVVKHADARTASLSLDSELDSARLTVSDDGVGFDASDAGRSFDPSGGFGLFSIGEQLAHLGGELRIESAPGAGTRASASLPIRAATAA